LKRWQLSAAIVALCGFGHTAAALDIMTGDGFLIAMSQDEAAKTGAKRYIVGTMETLIVLNEVLYAEGAPLFCLTDERAAVLDTDRLGDEFVDWLKQPAKGNVSNEQLGALPVSVLSWGFLGAKFACAQGEDRKADSDIRSRLLESMRK
jgi:hypothetical protein